MLFIRPVQRVPSQEGTSSPRPRPPDGMLMIKWILKCFITGILLSGLAYWLVQIAGAQYLATLTSATLLSFLLVYIVWCLTVKKRDHTQTTDSVVSNEPSTLPSASIHPPLAPPPMNPALKYYGVPPRDCSPPPSYDEVLRQMGAEVASSSSNTYAFAGADNYAQTALNSCYDVEAPPIMDQDRIPTSVLTVTMIRTPITTQAASNNVQFTVPNTTQNLASTLVPNIPLTQTVNSTIDSESTQTSSNILTNVPTEVSTPTSSQSASNNPFPVQNPIQNVDSTPVLNMQVTQTVNSSIASKPTQTSSNTIATTDLPTEISTPNKIPIETSTRVQIQNLTEASTETPNATLIKNNISTITSNSSSNIEPAVAASSTYVSEPSLLHTELQNTPSTMTEETLLNVQHLDNCV